MLSSLQGCPEEVGDAQDRFGDVQDRLGMLRAPAHSSPTSLGALPWQGFCAMVGPQPCWCRQPCQGLLRS